MVQFDRLITLNRSDLDLPVSKINIFMLFGQANAFFVEYCGMHVHMHMRQLF